MEKGSKEGFVEPLRINMTLIRRRMKNPKLKFETLSVGSVSKTDVCLCYLRDTVSPEIIKEIKKRLSSSTLETVLSSSYLIPFLEEEKTCARFQASAFRNGLIRSAARSRREGWRFWWMEPPAY